MFFKKILPDLLLFLDLNMGVLMLKLKTGFSPFCFYAKQQKKMSVKNWSRDCILHLSHPRAPHPHLSLRPVSYTPFEPAPRVQPTPHTHLLLSCLSVIATLWPHQPTAINPVMIAIIHTEFQSSFLPFPAYFPVPKDTFSPLAHATLPRIKVFPAMEQLQRQCPAQQHTPWGYGVTEPPGNLRQEQKGGRKSGHPHPLPILPSVGEPSAY